MKRSLRLVAMLLVLIMTINVMPISVFASEVTNEQGVENAEAATNADSAQETTAEPAAETGTTETAAESEEAQETEPMALTEEEPAEEAEVVSEEGDGVSVFTKYENQDMTITLPGTYEEWQKTLTVFADTTVVKSQPANTDVKWYVNTKESHEGAKLLASKAMISKQPDGWKIDISLDYFKETTILGTCYYFCELTYVPENSTESVTVKSDILKRTIKAPEEKAFGVIVNEETVGRVTVDIEDIVPARDDLVNQMGEIIEDVGPAGKLISRKTLAIYPSDTMMTIIARACMQNGFVQEGGESGYLKKIEKADGTISRAEFDRGSESGWMGTLDNWFTTEGFDTYTVENGALRDGSYIKLMYTTDLGKDIGQDKNNTDRNLTVLETNVSRFNETGSKKFDSNIHEYHLFYPQVDPEWGLAEKYKEWGMLSDEISFKVGSDNSNYKIRIFADGVEYAPPRTSKYQIKIPVKVGTVIEIYNSSNAYGEIEQAALDAGYRITVLGCQLMLDSNSLSVTQISESGNELEDLSLSYAASAGINAGTNSYFGFTGTLNNYSLDPAKNVEKVQVQLNNLPEGAAAKIISLATGEEQAFDKDGKVILKESLLNPQVYRFNIEVTAEGETEYYSLHLTKKSNGITNFDLKGNLEAEETINGKLEGTLFQLDTEGKETGATGISQTVYDYNMYLGLKQASVTATALRGMNTKFDSITLKVDGEELIKAAKTSEITNYLNENPVVLEEEKTVLQILVDYPDTSTYDDLVYTFNIYHTEMSAADFEAMIQALPDVTGIRYSEHKEEIDWLKDFYDNYLDEEVKKQLSKEATDKLMASVEQLNKLYEAGLAQMKKVADLIAEFKDEITSETEITEAVYEKYQAQVREAQKQYNMLTDWVYDSFVELHREEYRALKTAFDKINRYAIASGNSIGIATDYIDDFMVSSNAYNLMLGAAEDAYEIVFRDYIASGDRGEACLPVNTPGVLKYTIADESIVTIKEVESTYVDKGLGGGGTYDDLLYYLIPKKAGTTTITVNLTDEEGVYYGQIPEIIIHVNSPEEAAIEDLEDKLTNINSLEKTRKYDTWHYWEGEEGAPFTFKVNGENPTVTVWEYMGDGRTDYEVAEDGTVTVLLKDGYNPIEVTATYEGKEVTQVYGIKGKVISYTIENKYRPGEELQEGDTAVIKITGVNTPVRKILRIYNPSNVSWIYDTADLPGQGALNTSVGGGQYSYGWKEILLTGSGTITLTNGQTSQGWYGSPLYSETSQGNTGEIAPTLGGTFSVIPDLSFEVAENEDYELKFKYNAEVVGSTEVTPGSTVTIAIPDLPVEEILEKYPFVRDEDHKEQFSKAETRFYVNIPGVGNIQSEVVSKPEVDVDEEAARTIMQGLKELTFTIPEDTPIGTYKVSGGYVYVAFTKIYDYGEGTSSEFLYKLEISDAEITVAAPAAPGEDFKEDIYKTTGDYLEALAKENAPIVNSIGGEWLVIGLARSGRDVPTEYYENVVEYLTKETDENGKLTISKATDYARIILALTAAGYDVTDVNGHNLLEGLTDMNFIKKTGCNGPVWALIALDSHNYEIPTASEDADQATREKLIDTILGWQLEDGGWAITYKEGAVANLDMTAMAIQALAPYYDTDEKVKAAVDRALLKLSDVQLADGTFDSGEGSSSETLAQVVVALAALGIDPSSDTRFIKNGVSVLEALSGFFVEGGGFAHLKDAGRNPMATEQGYYALTACARLLEEKTFLYDMTDVEIGSGKMPGESDDKDNPADDSDDKDNPAGDSDDKDNTTGGSDSSDGNTSEGDKKNPATGDTAPIPALMVIVLLSGLACAAVIRRKKENF